MGGGACGLFKSHAVCFSTRKGGYSTDGRFSRGRAGQCLLGSVSMSRLVQCGVTTP